MILSLGKHSDSSGINLSKQVGPLESESLDKYEEEEVFVIQTAPHHGLDMCVCQWNWVTAHYW